MSFVFQQKPVATIKAMSATSTDMFTIPGVAATVTSADNAASQINKILAIGNKEIVADEYMSLTQTKEAVEQ